MSRRRLYAAAALAIVNAGLVYHTAAASAAWSASPALVASMEALAAPVAGRSDVVVECADIPYAGLAYPWETPPRLVVSTGDCENIERIEWHQRFPAGTASLRVLLHEAVHVRQGPSGVFDEHEAECGSLAALGASLATLGYDGDWTNAAVRFEREMILQEQAPYGGACPATADRPAERRTARASRRRLRRLDSGR